MSCTVHITGRLGQDPRLFTTKSSIVTLMSVASSRRVKRNGQWEDATEWHRVKVWGNRAQSCADYLSKGSAVYIVGHLQTQKFQDKETGPERELTQVIVDHIEFLSSKHKDTHNTEGEKPSFRKER